MWNIESSDEYDAWFLTFYKDLIAESEVIVERHEKELENERRNKNDGK